MTTKAARLSFKGMQLPFFKYAKGVLCASYRLLCGDRAPPLMAISILSLHTYPVKSCAGMDHARIHIDQGGLHQDRQWVVVDGQGVFMTQRQHARMALIRPGFDGDGNLTLDAPGMPTAHIPTGAPSRDAAPIDVRIWRSNTLGADEGDEAAAWFSAFLQTPCRLLHVHPKAQRLASPEHVHAWRSRHGDLAPAVPPRHAFGFADGFPFLVANQQSLDALNQRLQAKGLAPVPMDRFRPNIVVQGLDAYEEDYLAGMRTAGMTFAFVKRCARCPIPNIDQATAIQAAEPGITLAEHRQFPEGILFGVNAVVGGAQARASLHIGDLIEPEFDL